MHRQVRLLIFKVSEEFVGCLGGHVEWDANSIAEVAVGALVAHFDLFFEMLRG